MTEKIKLIWDFRGPAAQHTAIHHEIHLQDFIKAKNLEYTQTGVMQINEIHSIAHWIVPKTEMIKFRDILKPHRATLVEE